MKKRVSVLIYSITAMVFIFILLDKAGSLDSIYSKLEKKDEFYTEVASSKSKDTIPFIAYIPNPKNDLLEPEVLDISPKGDVYENLIKSLISSNKDYFKEGYKVVSVERKDTTMKINLSSEFRSDLYVDEQKFNLVLMSFVNTASEIKGVEFVEIYSGNEKIVFKGSEKFRRNNNLINVKTFDSPDKVLREQMKLEQKGEFLKSYLLMSFKNSTNRKMYYEYIEEMEDIKEVGFLSGDFIIKDTIINNDEATVNVEFNNVNAKGEAVNTVVMPVKCIKLNGKWMVDW